MVYKVSDYLKESFRCYPNQIALKQKDTEMTYSSYRKNVYLVAYDIISRNLFKEPIAILMNKGISNIVSFLGVAFSGNYYTVIDSKMPDSRIKKILDTFQPKLIIFDEPNRNKAVEVSGDAVALCYEELIGKELNADTIETVDRAESRIIDTDILYVLFTSGSTGVPKGVIINHKSVIDYIEWAVETFHFDNYTIFGNQAPFYFDNSVLDIFSAIRVGGCLNIIPQTYFSFPIRLLEYVRDNKINTVFWVPTVLSRVADVGILDKCDISCLKNVLFAGEVMPAKQLNIWMRRLPGAVFANLYGPTEITVDCTYYIVDRKIEDNESVPIGYPCRNSDIIVLNEKDEPVSQNEKGELCVRGSSLSMGYYNNPERTAQSFVQNPLNKMYHELIYRTGDIVHYNDRGEIIYDGRVDSQIKHTGHRVELGEIETAVSALEGISMNACIHKAETDQIVLFFTGDIAEESIRKELSVSLPEYMLPNVCIRLKAMPLNMNGKIDRKKLASDYTIDGEKNRIIKKDIHLDERTR